MARKKRTTRQPSRSASHRAAPEPAATPKSSGRGPRAAAIIGAAVVLAGGGLWWTMAGSSFVLEPNADRNVLLVTIDTLRADAVGSYGGTAATPNLDALAARGARFTFAHAHAVLTLPSHASILTGRLPYEHGLRDNVGYRLRAGDETLATALAPLGFATGAFVSAFPLDQRYGLTRGFDVYDDRISEVGSSVDIGLPERRADATVAAALSWIRAQQRKWLGWVHLFDPHAPYAAPDEWRSRYPSDAYAAEVAWTDFALAPLLAQLEQERRPTLVIVTSDHGESLGEHGEMTHGVFAYESTLRVPLIVAEIVPGRSGGRGRTIDRPARLVDIAPTVLRAVGAGTTNWPGASLFGDETGARPTYFESMMPTLARGWAPLRGVIVEREKYIDLPIAELYDLASDPGEQQNLAPEKIDRREVLTGVLRGFSVAAPDRPGEEPEAARERLRALGYTGGSPAPARDRYTEDDDPKRLIDIDRMIHSAGERFRAGRPDEALQIYGQILQRRSDTADAYRNMAFTLWQTGRPEMAIATLEAAMKNGVRQRDLQVRLGTYLTETGQTARAIALLETLPTDDTEALNALGIAYGQAGRVDDAFRVFKAAIALDESNGLAHGNTATLLLRAGDVAAAEASVRKALDIDPTIATANTTLGVILAKTNRRTEAIDAWKRAVALEPTEFDALYNLVIELARQGRTDEARQYGERFVKTAPPARYGPDIEQVRRFLQQTPR